MCVDYRDLNKASPKDDFPLPHIDMLVDSTAKSKVFSFMDGFSAYNEIKMAPEDREKTSFITPWGTLCYRVMPFGLINAGATYQRGMTTIFHDMIHKEINVYVDCNTPFPKNDIISSELINIQRSITCIFQKKNYLNRNIKLFK